MLQINAPANDLLTRLQAKPSTDNDFDSEDVLAALSKKSVVYCLLP